VRDPSQWIMIVSRTHSAESENVVNVHSNDDDDDDDVDENYTIIAVETKYHETLR